MSGLPVRLREAGRELLSLDKAVYSAVQSTPTPQIDLALARISRAADHSKLWMGMAALMAASGRRPRRAALMGLGSLAVTSATVNLAVQPIPRRRRPSVTDSVRTHGVRMPGSHSWPSGHTASAFAFATGAGGELPELDSALRLAATVVAYSRVHTGVHYPGDVVAGSMLGTVLAQVTAAVTDRYLAARA